MNTDAEIDNSKQLRSGRLLPPPAFSTQLSTVESKTISQGLPAIDQSFLSAPSASVLNRVVLTASPLLVSRTTTEGTSQQTLSSPAPSLPSTPSPLSLNLLTSPLTSRPVSPHNSATRLPLVPATHLPTLRHHAPHPTAPHTSSTPSSVRLQPQNTPQTKINTTESQQINIPSTYKALQDFYNTDDLVTAHSISTTPALPRTSDNTYSDDDTPQHSLGQHTKQRVRHAAKISIFSQPEHTVTICTSTTTANTPHLLQVTPTHVTNVSLLSTANSSQPLIHSTVLPSAPPPKTTEQARGETPHLPDTRRVLTATPTSVTHTGVYCLSPTPITTCHTDKAVVLTATPPLHLLFESVSTPDTSDDDEEDAHSDAHPATQPTTSCITSTAIKRFWSDAYLNHEEDLYADLDLNEIELSATMAEPRILDTFKGLPSENADEWIRNFQKYTVVKKFDSTQAAASASLFLRDAAKSWYNSLPPRVTESLDEFIHAFNERYVQPNHLQWKIETEIYDVVQKPSQTVHDYLTEMQFKAQRSKINAEILLQLAVKGLRPHIRSQVLQHERLDWDTLVKWATLAESTTTVTATESAELTKILETMNQMKSSITNLEKSSKPAEVSELSAYPGPSAAFQAPYYEPTVELMSVPSQPYPAWQQQQQQQPQWINKSWRPPQQPAPNWHPTNGYSRNNNSGYNYRGSYNNNNQFRRFNNSGNQRFAFNNSGTRFGNPPMQRYNSNYSNQQQQTRNYTPRGQSSGPSRGGRGNYNNYRSNNAQPHGNFAALPQVANQQCTHCAGPCHADMSECPAKGQFCGICNKVNHYAKACRQGARLNVTNAQ